MVFVFDLDDTVCDSDGYSEKYIEKFFAEHKLPYKKIFSKARFAEKKFDWDDETALKWYKEYGDEMMENFPCKKNAVEFINGMHDAGHKIVIATARATDWHVNPKDVTLRWLKKCGIKYDKAYFGRCDKEKICEDEDADVFVDDDLEITARVAQSFKGKKNKHVYLCTSDFNQDFPAAEGVERILDFDDLAEKVRKEAQI